MEIVKQMISRALLAATAALAAIAAIIAADFTAPAPAQAQSEGAMLETTGAEQISGRIVARRLSTDRIEFGWQPSGSDERILPRARYFPRPADATVDRWLSSSPVELEGVAIGQINARLRAGGRIEFAFTPTDGERILPPSRYFPHNATIDRWLRSTEITIGPPNSEPEQPSPTDPNAFLAVSAGHSHSCALRASGAIVCWGNNFKGYDRVDQSVAPAGSYSTVSAGSFLSCAIRSDSGAIECWGDNSSGKTNAPTGRYTAISAVNHTCAIREGSGAIVCWGYNASGQTNAPTGRYTAISAGSSHTCAIRESGAIECWGNNYVGQAAPPAGSYSAIAAGGKHSCAIRSDSGAIECWGYNASGQAAPPAGSYSAIAAGRDHSCAIRSDSGAIECWGNNHVGQAAPPAGSFTAVSAGTVHSCAIRESGAIECWGSNSIGQTDAPPK